MPCERMELLFGELIFAVLQMISLAETNMNSIKK